MRTPASAEIVRSPLHPFTLALWTLPVGQQAPVRFCDAGREDLRALACEWER